MLFYEILMYGYDQPVIFAKTFFNASSFSNDLFLLFCFIAPAQTKTSTPSSTTVSRPKLVVGIVIDQMRWDYLYRFTTVLPPMAGSNVF